MKTVKLVTALALVILLSLVTFYSCRKTDSTTTKEQDNLIELYRQKLKNEPLTSTEMVNLIGKGYYADINGNKITVVPGQPKSGILDYTCPDPGSSEVAEEFVSMEREYTCGVGYRFVVTYKVTSEFQLLLANPNNSSQFSVGRVRLRNSGVTIYTTPTAALLSIQFVAIVGQNSNGKDLNEFIVKYRTDIVSETTYNSATSIDPNLFAYTDCANYPIITIPFSPQQSAPGYQHTTLPCLRVDKIYFNPSFGTPPNYTPPSLAGANATGSGCFPVGYVFPDKQEIHFKKNTSDNYTGTFNLYTQGLTQSSVATPEINYWDAWYIDRSNLTGLIPGNVQVRYHNKQTGTSNGGPCVTTPDGTWVYETWYIK